MDAWISAKIDTFIDEWEISRYNPTLEAFSLLNDYLLMLVKHNKEVFIINHHGKYMDL